MHSHYLVAGISLPVTTGHAFSLPDRWDLITCHYWPCILTTRSLGSHYLPLPGLSILTKLTRLGGCHYRHSFSLPHRLVTSTETHSHHQTKSLGCHYQPVVMHSNMFFESRTITLLPCSHTARPAIWKLVCAIIIGANWRQHLLKHTFFS